MITRIVKMNFRPEETENFLLLFEEVKNRIRGFEGCCGLTLLRDIHNPDLMFTYSLWNSEQSLERYRKSELFSSTWEQTKSKFSSPASAWSVMDQSNTEQ